MPNWVSNYTVIKGEDKIIDEIAEKFEESGFEAWFPTPEELLDRESPNDKDPEEMKKKYGAPDWYEWNNKNWGTKWNATDRHVLCQDTKENTLSYNTAWAPPIEFWVKLSQQYPDIEIYMEFIDENYCFVGDAVIKDGVILELNEYENINDQIDWLTEKFGIEDARDAFEWALDDIYEKIGKELGEKMFELPLETQIKIIKIYFNENEKEMLNKVKKIIKED